MNADLDSLFTSNKKYGTILVDPPWPETGGGKIRRGADRHYSLMTINEIKGMPVQRLVDSVHGAHLYLWTTNNFLKHAFGVLDAWEARYVTCITWVKDGRLGLGQYFRGMTEHVLFARWGCPPYRNMTSGKRAQGLTAMFAPRGEHSEKPEMLYVVIETVSHGPYLELFARRKRAGWTTWGNEIYTKQ